MAKTPEQREKEKLKAEKPAEEKEVKKEVRQEKKGEIRYENVIRLTETNLDGTKPVRIAIRKIAGISFMMSNAIGKVSGFGGKKLSELSEPEIKMLEDIMTSPEKYGIPSWMFNRKKDPETNVSRHLIVSNLDLIRKQDINMMKKMRSYKGIRHGLGLTVRGQRTRSSFRKGSSVGVVKQKQKPGETKESKEKK
jgi:small subunit ribosomal protein S13